MERCGSRGEELRETLNRPTAWLRRSCGGAAAGRVPRRGVRSSGSGACGAAVAAAGRAARVRDEPRAGAACVRAGVWRSWGRACACRGRACGGVGGRRVRVGGGGQQVRVRSLLLFFYSLMYFHFVTTRQHRNEERERQNESANPKS